MASKSSDLILLLRKAWQGDEDSRNELIQVYTPFILKTAASICGRYIKIGEDDEASIALIAFNEAINKYDEKRKSSFLSYAEVIIKRRLIDYHRKEQRDNKLIGYTSLQFDDQQQDRAEVSFARRQAAITFREQQEALERHAEIIQFTKLLSDFNISFQDLVKMSPRHQDARRRVIEICYLIAEDREYKEFLMSRKELPLKKIAERIKVSRRTLERHRKYIIAVSLILIKRYTYLLEYIKRPC
jgi:RNA polymerase sigma factor